MTEKNIIREMLSLRRSGGISVDTYVKETLREIRLLEKLTQEEVASKIGINHRSYQQYELGKRNPSLEFIETFCYIFGLSLSDFFSADYGQQKRERSSFEKICDLLDRESKVTKINKLSEITSIHPFILGMLNSGRSRANAETLARLADYFNVSTDYLVGRETPDMHRLSEEEDELIKMWRTMTNHDQAQAMGVIKTITQIASSSSTADAKSKHA